MWINRSFTMDYNSNFNLISYLIVNEKTFIWLFFFFLFIVSSLSTFYNSDHEETKSESDDKKLQRNDENSNSYVQYFSFFLTKSIEEIEENRAPN
jgi:hypothetical protein